MSPTTHNNFPALSPVVAGVWRLHEWGWNADTIQRWIEACLALDITSFDHADVYGNYSTEAVFGEALRRTPGLRQQIQLVTKCNIRFPSENRPGTRLKHYDTSHAYVCESVDRSLRALGTDYIDLLLIHRPDALCDPNQLAETFQHLQREGKVRAFGVSNHLPPEFAMLHRRFPLCTNQIEFSALQMKALADGTLTQCTDLGIRPMIWSPLGGGALFRDSDNTQIERVRIALTTLAETLGVSMATAAFAWIMRHPSRPIVITGSGRIESPRDAVAAVTITLSAEQWYEVWQASMGREVA